MAFLAFLAFFVFLPNLSFADRALPAGVSAEPLEVAREGNQLRGVLWRPSTSGRTPLVLIVPGSLAIDRDGNGGGLRCDLYRQLAEALAARGIASVRYDKRGVGESTPPGQLAQTLRDLALDAAGFWDRVKDDRRFGPRTVLGHSEGALVAEMVAHARKPEALILVGGSGRPVFTILREELSRAFSTRLMTEFDRLAADINAERELTNIPPELQKIFRPALRPHLKMEWAMDPAALLKKIAGPITVVQGEVDAHVDPEDTRRLSTARAGIKLVTLPRVNHLLKQQDQPGLPHASYRDPSLPLGPGVIDAIAGAVAR